MTASHLHRYPSANWHKSHGPVSPRSGSRMGRLSTSALPAARKCLLPCKLDRRPESCLLVDGHWRWWPDLRAPSLVCFEYSRRLSRSHPLSGGISLPLISTFTSCCATEEQSASSASGEQGVRAMTTTQARRKWAGEQSWRASCPCLSWQGERLPGPRSRA